MQIGHTCIFHSSGATATTREQQCRNCSGDSSHFQFPGTEMGHELHRLVWEQGSLPFPMFRERDSVLVQWPDFDFGLSALSFLSAQFLTLFFYISFLLYFQCFREPYNILSVNFSHKIFNKFSHETKNWAFPIYKYCFVVFKIGRIYSHSPFGIHRTLLCPWREV